MKATIKDVAKAAGVSTGTVDRVLHKRPYVKNEIRQRVLDEIERLGYVPNRYASILSTGSRKTLGLICYKYPAFFWDEIVNGASASASELSLTGIDLVVRRIHRRVQIKDYIMIVRELVDSGIDMLITTGINSEEVADCLSSLRIPVALVNVNMSCYLDKIFYLGPDEERFGSIAGGLIGKLAGGSGVVVVANLHGNSPYVGEKRLRGFERTLHESFPLVTLAETVECTLNDGQISAVPLLSSIRKYEPVAIYLSDGSLLSLTSAITKININGKNKRPIIVGHELGDEARALLRCDKIDMILHQRPYNQGYEAIKHAYTHLFFRKTPKNSFITADLSIVTREMIL